MLDLKFIRENPNLVKEAIAKKRYNIDIDQLLQFDAEKRQLQFSYDNLKAHQNKISKEIALKKQNKEDVSGIINEMQTVANQLKETTGKLSQVSEQIEKVLVSIPNIPQEDVPVGKDENDNQFVREWQDEKRKSPILDRKLFDHLELAEGLNLLDLPRGAKISGSGFPIYTHYGALLERALINFMLDFHIKNHNYREIAVPVVVNRQAMFGTGQLPKLEEDMYHIAEDDLFLIPTGEVPVTNIYHDEILSFQQLPKKFVTYTPCFRREAGSYGKETKGLQRLHQFNKVELVRFVEPRDSSTALEEMVNEAENILKALALPYRVMQLNTSDLSFASAKTYDLEVWTPGMKKFLEVSSVSNFADFQARRAAIRYRDESGKVNFVHTLNGSGLATPRTYIAILENYQNEDGSVTIPDVMQNYMHGMTRLTAPVE
ncbi:MAG: serine--tRNA ligase [Candidatus Cloacimonetes bacterium]|nr:serine--tRNA ligase [Candidatus Cloacimonadota bacterium]